MKITVSILLLPIFFVRYLLLLAVKKDALSRAAHYAPMKGAEQIAYLIYQAATLAIVAYSFFLFIDYSSNLFPYALVVYFIGLILYAVAVVNFAQDGPPVKTSGLYKFSRNPMYVAQFICFLGMSMLSGSIIMLGMVIIFQISAHWIILAEERWCIKTYGDYYLAYMQETRRYF